MQKEPMTVRGADLLKEELKQLKSVERPAVITAIAEARAHGDLKENAEYHAAREKQGFVEGRIQDIEGKLGNAEIIDIIRLAGSDRVMFGATVTLENADTEEQIKYQIVGDDEANIKEGRISVRSPIGKGVIGKHVDDEFVVQTPSGKIIFAVIQVEYL